MQMCPLCNAPVSGDPHDAEMEFILCSDECQEIWETLTPEEKHHVCLCADCATGFFLN